MIISENFNSKTFTKYYEPYYSDNDKIDFDLIEKYK